MNYLQINLADQPHITTDYILHYDTLYSSRGTLVTIEHPKRSYTSRHTDVNLHPHHQSTHFKWVPQNRSFGPHDEQSPHNNMGPTTCMHFNIVSDYLQLWRFSPP